MAESSEYRDRGLGDEGRRHSGRKRTRGEEDLEGGKRARRGYDDYDGVRRRSLSPRDEVHRDIRRKGQYDERRRSREADNTSRSNGMSQREGRDKRHEPRRSPSISTRHHYQHDDAHSHRHHRHHSRHKHRSPTRSTRTPDELPLDARPLVRSDLDAFRPLLAQYLEVQKGKDIAAMDEREVRGRWKSFVGKWNRGELAEGWYHAETLDEARRSGFGVRRPAVGEEQVGGYDDSIPSGEENEDRKRERDEEEEEDDDDYGPILPPGSAQDQSRDPSESAVATTKPGPGIPNLEDLDQRREDLEEERLKRIDSLRLARRADRAEQRSRLEELAPRAEPGTRERRLEKRREVNDKMRGFRDRSPGATAEVGEAELMGGNGGDDGVAEYKRAKAAAERKKTEREVRREEEARAKAAEREERVREYRRREEDTMEVLKRIAKERFG